LISSNPGQCKFDPAKLQCRSGDGPGCLTAAEVETARKIYQGPRRPDGTVIARGYSPGSELGWKYYMSDTVPGTAADFYRFWVFEDKNYDSRRFDYDQDWLAVTRKTVLGQTMPDVVNASTNLSGFFGRGGKLLVWAGSADPDVPALNTVEYYEDVVRDSPPAATAASARLFLAPGTAHCGGGEGPNRFDMLALLEHWVEQGETPRQALASQYGPAGDVIRTRPLCPYPEIAIYDGRGDANKAASFRCAAPTPAGGQ
jgi:feruloyl esterase